MLGPERIVGTFAGSDSLLPGILDEPADYFSIGPVFPTTTKQTDKAPIGVEGVRRLREQAGPDVGAGGGCRHHAGDRAAGAGGGGEHGGRGGGPVLEAGSGGGVSQVDGSAEYVGPHRAIA